MKYCMQFEVNGRWYEVEATNATLQDLCMGPHARQRDIKEAHGRLKDPSLDKNEVRQIMSVDMRPPQAHGELKGVRLRWPRGRVAPFCRGHAA